MCECALGKSQSPVENNVVDQVEKGVRAFDQVSALPGTASAGVLAEIRKLIEKKGITGLIVCEAVVCHGLCLRDKKNSAKFSPKYVPSHVVVVLEIGANLPKDLYRNVAGNILSMVLRGPNWRDKNGKVVEMPYGAVRTRPRRKPPFVRSRGRWGDYC